MQPANPDYVAIVTDSFSRQRLNATIGATLSRVAPGEIHIDLPFDERLTQQNGFMHAGAIASIADNACGYAALSVVPAGCDVLAVEFKINLVAPARAPTFQARGRVLRHGRTLIIAAADVFGIDGTQEELVATVLETVFVKRP